MTEGKNWNPNIVGFMCNWCSYAGADLAGTSRIQYPPYLRIIRVMCSGRVDPIWVVEAFLKGADGVMVMGCHPGDCHYISGNYQAEKKILATISIVKMAGISEKRLFLDWVSAAEGMRFATLVTKFTKTIKELGPLNLSQEIKERLECALATVKDDKVRWLIGREWKMEQEGNTYGESVTKGQFQGYLSQIIKDTYNKNIIRYRIKKQPKTVTMLSSETGIEGVELLSQLVDLVRIGKVEIVEIKNKQPYYRWIGD